MQIRRRAGGASGKIPVMPVTSLDDANAFHRAMRMVAATKAGRVLFRPTAHRLDRLVSTLTQGRYSFAGLAAGLPSVMLTTTGAKSGEPRTVALLGIPHPDGVAVVAANYGDARHPGWYHNLQANPAATAVIEGETCYVTARLATPAEPDEIWERGTAIYPGLTKEQAWAGDRRIEALILDRHSANAGRTPKN
jgi:deazaflavin-dependent oxidoreductase (nitroreductase family)